MGNTYTVYRVGPRQEVEALGTYQTKREGAQAFNEAAKRYKDRPEFEICLYLDDYDHMLATTAEYKRNAG